MNSFSRLSITCACIFAWITGATCAQNPKTAMAARRVTAPFVLQRACHAQVLDSRDMSAQIATPLSWI